ncbi:recombination protein NinG [Elizabethkingia miricola]|uniref:recombination protein NinG n=1 Tax=Elizabethkingia miricola TaxID=172045 RepID=UPI0020186A47|nr:recombination protein NinG [Elizabethkingia miricola]MCL1658630.1 recombination protein NinG [Elizabethkingia miricola]
MIEAKTIQKYKSKTVPQLVQIAQRYFNAYIRKRDSFDGFFKCISCGEIKPINKLHAGHFFSVGNYGIVRFDVDNCHGQCHKCNTFLHGDLYNYQINLIEKIGIEKFENLHKKAHDLDSSGRSLNFKYDRFLLIDIIERYKNARNI